MSGELTVSPTLRVVRTPTLAVPVQIESASGAATERFVEFFIATIRNPNTRRAYHRAVMRFFEWCDQVELEDLGGLRPLHVATYIEDLGRSHERASVKLHLAALRRLLGWMVTYLQGVGHYRLSRKWRRPRESGNHGRPCFNPHHPAL